MPPRIKTPWGWWQVLAQGPDWKFKQLMVLPGERTSLQYHRHRYEYWLVIDGSGRAHLGGHRKRLERGFSTTVPSFMPHRLEGLKPDGVAILEIQWGSKCLETDIVRQADNYGRR